MTREMRKVGGISGETDYLRRYNNKEISKQKKIRSIKIQGLHILVILVVVSFIAFSIYQTGKFLLSWEKLNVSSYKLINSPTLRAVEVHEILKRHSGNILAVDFNRLRKELMNIGEVREVGLSRILPDTIRVEFELRKPAFQVENNNKYSIIDNEGVILYKAPQGMDDLITIKNVTPRRHRKLIPYLAQLNLIKKHIDYVALLEPYGLRLKLKGIKETFYPGNEDFAGKINNYLKVRDKLVVDVNKIKNVDLRFEDRFYLEFEEEVKQDNEK